MRLTDFRDLSVQTGHLCCNAVGLQLAGPQLEFTCSTLERALSLSVWWAARMAGADVACSSRCCGVPCGT